MRSLSLTHGGWQSDVDLLVNGIASSSYDESTVLLSLIGYCDETIETKPVLAANESVGC